MIKKAVIPAAGLGTRFLPATKAQPKEMLPIIDTPTIQYVVQEAVDSGIEDILIISGKGKRALEDHFDRNFELEMALEEKNNSAFNEIRKISDMANIHYVRQMKLRGLGDAIYHARHHIGNEPFAVLLGDTIINSVIPVTQQLIDMYEQYKQIIVGVETVPKDKISRYGVIGGNKLNDSIWQLNEMVEKPDPDEAPSNLAFAGRYILTPEIFQAIEETEAGKNNEIQLTDAMKRFLSRGSVYSYTIEGKRYDIGDKLDYLKTTVEFGLLRKEFREEFLKFIHDIISKESGDL